ncbi:sirohydrochlorin chelatase [Corynebacterium sp. L4756]|uniref:sirohydrochlorin chelatase n=1 Tax=unclassified Corynebacterium TaxID=2624378 RepID=UPI00374CB0D7
MKRAFIALSHGSRHPQAARGVDELVAATARATGAYGVAAHLEFNQPTLADATLALQRRGFEQATVMPLLFTNGFHMRHDVPNVISHTRGVDLHLTSGMGTGEGVLSALQQRLARDIAPGENPHVILYAVGSSNVPANEAVMRLSVRLADATGFSTSALFATSGAGKAGYLWGNEGLRLQATAHPRVHVLPLFVTQGLLLDHLNAELPGLMDTTRSHITSSAPLGTLLSDVLAHRFTQSLRITSASAAGAHQTT